MKRRYSHLGPVTQPHGKPLTRETLKALHDARAFMGWKLIADYCRVSRSTMWRLMCGGNAHELTREAVATFLLSLKDASPEAMAMMMPRWSDKRRAAHEKRRAA
jgi:hypothetical protein